MSTGGIRPNSCTGSHSLANRSTGSRSLAQPSYLPLQRQCPTPTPTSTSTYTSTIWNSFNNSCTTRYGSVIERSGIAPAFRPYTASFWLITTYGGRRSISSSFPALRSYSRVSKLGIQPVVWLYCLVRAQVPGLVVSTYYNLGRLTALN
jgi:hypothetical protein